MHVLPLLDVIAYAVYPFKHDTLLEECSITMPVSSMFQIFDGLSFKLLVEITDPYSSKYLSNTPLDVRLALTSDSV